MSKKLENGKLLLDRTGAIVDVDARVIDILGYTGDELKGTTFESHLTDASKTSFINELANVANGGVQTVYSNTFHSKGFVLPLELTLDKKSEAAFRFNVHDLSRRGDLESELE
jgi:PAS domain S-box-containing protein